MDVSSGFSGQISVEVITERNQLRVRQLDTEILLPAVVVLLPRDVGLFELEEARSVAVSVASLADPHLPAVKAENA
jgi:hypothetical protein